MSSDDLRRPRTFAPGETVNDDDLRQLMLGQMWFNCQADSAEIMEEHERRFDEAWEGPEGSVSNPYWRLTREQVYERMDRAGLEGDPRRWYELAEHFRDKMTAAEMLREAKVLDHALGLLEASDTWDFGSIARITANSFDFVNLVEGTP